MPDTITASEKALVDVFCNKFRFSIPDYQRPYSWEAEEAKALFDDLRTAMGMGDPREASPYFMGSIVLIKDPDQPEADVVDGQQRLTTLTILICVLRDRLEADLENSKEELRTTSQSYVAEAGNLFAGAQNMYRLRLRPRDADFFETHIQHRGATNSLPDAKQIQSDAPRNIVNNACLLAKCVDEIAPDERIRLLTFMIQRCFLVVVEASHEDSAYRVFSVLNDRGLNLSPTDILKAEILGAIKKAEILGAIEEAQRRTYTEIWENIEESLGRDRFRDLFAHIRMIHHPVKLAGTLVAEFRERVIAPTHPTEFMDEILEPMSEAYLWIVNQDFPGEESKSINRSLRHLALLDNVDWQPPTILFLSQFRDQPERIVRFLSALDALAYGMFICRDSVNKRIARYAEIIREIDAGNDVLADSSPIYLSDEQKTEVLTQLDGPVYEIPRICRPILLRLDEAVAEDAANYDYHDGSIEHVLPQNPAEDSEWMTLFDEAERGSWTHRLANLVLLSQSKNARAQNYSFERKKEEYFTRNGICTFALTSRVLLADSWTPALLAERQEELLETCRKIWNLPPAH